MSALGRLVLATRARWRRLALAVVLGAGAVGAAVGLLATSGYLISRAAQRPEILSLTVAIVAVRAFALLRAGLRYGERLATHDVALRVLADVRARFFARLAPLVPADVALRRGDLLSRFVADVDSLQDLYVRGLAPPLVAALSGAAAIGVAAWLLPEAGLALALGLGASALLAPAATAAAARGAGRRQAPARAELTAELVETLRGAPELVVAGREGDWAARLAASDRRLAAAQARDALAGGLAAGLSVLLPLAAVVAVVAVALPAVHDGRLDGVALAALALLSLAAFEATAPLAAAAQQLGAGAHAAQRLEEITERRPSVVDPPRPRPLPPDGELALEHVRVRLAAGGPWVLDGVDLRLAPGRRLALVGASGAGKTTLAGLLARLRDPDAGRVALGGVDVRALALGELRRAVRLAPQDAHLFATSIRDNLVLARPGAGDDQLLAALDAVGLGEWVGGLPAGLGTPVGEHGSAVSGGQRRRIAAARVLLADARFLVLDEPAAHLDRAAGEALLRRLAASAGARGLLVVTHALAGLDVYDELVVLERGRVVERGTHRELLARGGAYAALARAARE